MLQKMPLNKNINVVAGILHLIRELGIKCITCDGRGVTHFSHKPMQIMYEETHAKLL